MHRKLNARQERFIAEYLVDHNATAAARRAGYADSTKGTHACRLLKNPGIAARLALEMNDMLAQIKLGALDTLRARARVAFFDPAEILDGAGMPRPFGELKEETRAVLAIRYELKESGAVVRVRQCPREPALAALERYQAAAQKLQRQMLEDMPWEEDDEEGGEEGREGGDAAGARGKAPRVVLDYERIEEARALHAQGQGVAHAQARPAREGAVSAAPAAAPAPAARSSVAPVLAPAAKASAAPKAMVPEPEPTPPDPLRQLVEARVAQAAQVLLREAERKAGRAPVGQVQAPRYTPWVRRERPAVGDPGPVFYGDDD